MNCPKCGGELEVGEVTFRLKGWLYWSAWPFGNLFNEPTAWFRANGATEETETFYTGLPVPAEYCGDCGTTVVLKEQLSGAHML